ncbi:hypothetical protein EJ04DRAFT_551372 [Polyplosphaeria fusca]|uniref:Uncharacterized protein n=1 Tax=Polyplosphaeria fusca TaxID=682080 RepID=A0A9P4R4H4_9PLEO|nr:hypothetical protein EJ04DRAFT_551372 [Polyplosphaeria fusca]
MEYDLDLRLNQTNTNVSSHDCIIRYHSDHYPQSFEDEEPGQICIRFTWKDRFLVNGKGEVDRLFPTGHALSSRWHIRTFLRNDSHADVYCVSDMTKVWSMTRKTYQSSAQYLDKKIEAHVFFRKYYGNSKTFAKRHKNRLQNSANFIASFWDDGRNVIIVEVPKLAVVFQSKQNKIEFPILGDRNKCTTVTAYQRRRLRGRASYAQVASAQTGESKITMRCTKLHSNSIKGELSHAINAQPESETSHKDTGQKERFDDEFWRFVKSKTAMTEWEWWLEFASLLDIMEDFHRCRSFWYITERKGWPSMYYNEVLQNHGTKSSGLKQSAKEVSITTTSFAMAFERTLLLSLTLMEMVVPSDYLTIEEQELFIWTWMFKLLFEVHRTYSNDASISLEGSQRLKKMRPIIRSQLVDDDGSKRIKRYVNDDFLGSLLVAGVPDISSFRFSSSKAKMRKAITRAEKILPPCMRATLMESSVPIQSHLPFQHHKTCKARRRS